jgi:hypothetical protein
VGPIAVTRRQRPDSVLALSAIRCLEWRETGINPRPIIDGDVAELRIVAKIVMPEELKNCAIRMVTTDRMMHVSSANEVRLVRANSDLPLHVFEIASARADVRRPLAGELRSLSLRPQTGTLACHFP